MLGNFAVQDLHVGSSDRACIKHVSRKLRPEVRYSREHRKDRHSLYRDALKSHHDQQNIVKLFRL